MPTLKDEEILNLRLNTEHHQPTNNFLQQSTNGLERLLENGHISNKLLLSKL
jgi:hypothetical protein